MKSYLRIIGYLKPFSVNIILNLVLNVFAIIFSLFSFLMVIPFLEVLFQKAPVLISDPGFSFSINGFKEYFNYYLNHLVVEKGQVNALLFICAIVLITSFFKNLFRYLALYFMAAARNGVTRDIRNHVYKKVLYLPLAFFSEERKGDLLSRFSSDVQEVEFSILNSIEVVFKEPVTLVIYVTTLFVISPPLTFLILVMLPITALIIGRIGRKLKQAAARGQTRLGNLMSMVEEAFGGLRIIKAFTAEEKQYERFSNENFQHFKIMKGLIRRRDLSSPLTEFMSTIVIVVVLYIGSNMVLDDSGAIQAETFIGFLVIFSQLINPAKKFSSAYYQVQKGIASAQRIEEVLDAEEVIAEKKDARPIESFEQCIEYKDVGFAYDAKPVLQSVNTKIEKGKMVALVGQSGSGKSTFVDLLPRFFDVSNGKIMIDGVDIRNYKVHDLRNLFGIVSQEAILFNDTVYNNIAFGKAQVSIEEVEQASKIANAHEFIMGMPDGYQTIIGDRGMKLSGGEKQRLTIARAVLKNPPILILDEATSSLDSESERLVQDALYRLMQNRTSIVIAHRLSTIQFADEILVMQKGSIIERGNHIGLISKNGIYSRLVEMQAF